MRLIPVILMLTVLSAANFYVFYRIWQMMPPSLFGRIFIVIFALCVVVIPLVSFPFMSALPSPLVSILYKAMTSWLIVFLYLLIAFAVLDLLRITHILPLDKWMFNNWGSLGILFGAITLLLSIGYVCYKNKDRVDLSLTVNKEISNTNPLRIVAVSDLHLGYSIGKKEFEKWVELINKEEPDVVLIAGDITDNNVKPLYEQDMASVFRKIRSKYGVYTILGNHEYIAGESNASGFLRASGTTVLRDSISLIDNSFYIIGRDDRSNPKRKSTHELISKIDTSKPLILLDHQPYDLDETAENNIDLQISGHTHYGQVWPINWVTKALFEIPHGYGKKGNSHIYVSSGLGIWGGKFRIGSRSEYVVINLQGK